MIPCKLASSCRHVDHGVMRRSRASSMFATGSRTAIWGAEIRVEPRKCLVEETRWGAFKGKMGQWLWITPVVFHLFWLEATLEFTIHWLTSVTPPVFSKKAHFPQSSEGLLSLSMLGFLLVEFRSCKGSCGGQEGVVRGQGGVACHLVWGGLWLAQPLLPVLYLEVIGLSPVPKQLGAGSTFGTCLISHLENVLSL